MSKHATHKGAEFAAMPTPTGGQYGLAIMLTYFMFFMFAMTTDSVGEVIKYAKEELALTNTEASAFHWSTMIAIAASGVFLGFLADKLGRKRTIILGLGLYCVASAAFALSGQFYQYLGLLFISGLAIGVFKTAALALIGDVTTDSRAHTSAMNTTEGFFGVGAIVGPLLVVALTEAGLAWSMVYVIAAIMCVIMIILALRTPYPPFTPNQESRPSLGHTLGMFLNPYALGFSLAIAMYVAAEVAIFVWLPTFLEGFSGGPISMFFAKYAVMIFFILRAFGRFFGAWFLKRYDWSFMVAFMAAMILVCFTLSIILGQGAGVYLLPLSGLFMSVIYPTLNSKGISCFPKQDHGAIAGVILFFTAAAAAFGPVAMALVADHLGHGDMTMGFWLATCFVAILVIMAIWNYLALPAAARLGEGEILATEGA